MRLKSHVTFFLFPTLIALLIGGFFLFAYTKADIHLYINNHHSVWGDSFFRFWTYLGEGWLFLLAIPAVLFYSLRSGVQLALAGIFTLIFTSLFKKWIYVGEPRPIEYFKGIADLNLIQGVDMAHWNSFPSGHTMAAFSIWFSVALIVRRKYWSVLFFITAFLVGYSRMYLNQHFLVDVIAGAGLGLFCATVAWLISNQLKGDIWKKRFVPNT